MTDDQRRPPRRARGRSRLLRTTREAYTPRRRAANRYRASIPTRWKYCIAVRGLWNSRGRYAVATSRGYANGTIAL